VRKESQRVERAAGGGRFWSADRPAASGWERPTALSKCSALTLDNQTMKELTADDADDRGYIQLRNTRITRMVDGIKTSPSVSIREIRG